MGSLLFNYIYYISYMCITFLCHNVYFYITIYNKIHVNMYMLSVHNIFCASYHIYTVFQKYNKSGIFVCVCKLSVGGCEEEHMLIHSRLLTHGCQRAVARSRFSNTLSLILFRYHIWNQGRFPYMKPL